MQNTKKRYLVPIVLVFVSFVLVACGRDVSTVDSAIEGHWTMTDARMNGEPLEQVIQENEDIFDADALTGSESNQNEIEADFYYNEGTLTIVNADGEQTSLPYEIMNTDEENDSLTLETLVDEEEATLTINQLVNFSGEDRESISSTLNIKNLELTSQEDTEGMSELEQQANQLGQEFVMQLVQNIHLEFDLDYVDDSEAPAAE